MNKATIVPHRNGFGTSSQYIARAVTAPSDRLMNVTVASTARIAAAPLVTWDQELVARAGGVTPDGWLATNP